MITDPIANFLGSWSVQLNSYSIVFRIILSVFLSALIGWERSTKRHSAGLRTFMIVTLSGTVTMLIDLHINSIYNGHYFILSALSIVSAARIATRTLFFTSRNQIMGLTTSVSLWCSCILGLAIGAGLYSITAISYLVVLLCLSKLPYLEFFLKNRSNHFEIHLELKNSLNLQNFVTTIRKLGLIIDAIEMNPAYANSGLSVYSIAITISNEELKNYKTHKEIIDALSTLDYIYHIEEI